MARESNTGQTIRLALRAGKATFVKLNPTNGAGQPDYLACYRGVTLALEHKPPGKDRTAPGRRRLQEHQRALWRAAGAVTGIVRTRADVEQILAEIDRRLDQGQRPTEDP